MPKGTRTPRPSKRRDAALPELLVDATDLSTLSVAMRMGWLRVGIEIPIKLGPKKIDKALSRMRNQVFQQIESWRQFVIEDKVLKLHRERRSLSEEKIAKLANTSRHTVRKILRDNSRRF